MEGRVPMIRRMTIATFAALVFGGFLGIRSGMAQQNPRPSPTRPAPAPTPVPKGDLPTLPDGPGAIPADGLPPEIEAEPAPKPVALPAQKKAEPATPKRDLDPPIELPGGDPAPVMDGPAPEMKSDADLQRVQTTPPADTGGLPPAKERPGGAPAAETGPPPDPKWILPIDRLPLAPSVAGLTVEVQAPPTANLNRPLKFQIFVKNTGQAPAMGVMVYDRMPEGLEFGKSEPPPTGMAGDIYYWQLDSLGVGTEKTITVTATPRKTGDFDHAPTVALRTGSRSRTLVKQPKLKVEITQDENAKILKGKSVNMAVRVTNNGTGPARSVVVHANLSSGLKHDSGSAIEVAFKDYLGKEFLGPGESESIPLEVDTVAGGEQLCKVFALSPDVEESEEARAEVKVTVIEPKLVLELKGSSERYTDTVASYTLTLTNPGTATAKNVVAAAFLPNLSGKLVDKSPPEVKYVTKERKLSWVVGDLEPGAKREMKFNIQLGAVGVFKVEAATEAKGTIPYQSTEFSTHVVGMPDVKCQVVARTKVLDIGEETVYEVRLNNAGSKEATNLLVSAQLSEHLQVVQTGGTEASAKSTTETGEPRDAVFPPLTLAPGAEQTLWMRIKATKTGKSTCTVRVVLDESETVYTTTTKVQEPR